LRRPSTQTPGSFDFLANATAEEIDSDFPVAVLGQYQIRTPSRWLDEFRVHRPDRREILRDYRVCGTASFGNVTLQPSDESDVVGRIDEDLHIDLIRDCPIGVNQNTLEDDHGLRFRSIHLGASRVRPKIINGISTASPDFNFFRCSARRERSTDSG